MWAVWAVLALVFLSGGGGGGFSMFLTAEARKYLGRPYYLGAGLPNEPDHPDPPYLDCGLFTKKLIRFAYGVNVPRTVTEQVKAAPFTKDVSSFSREQLRGALSEGVFIAFDWTPETARYSHTGMFTSAGKVIHASSSHRKVVEVPLKEFSSGWRTLYSWKPII